MVCIIAEIHKKLTTGEDQLTGDFFGSLRYLPFEHGIKPILLKSVSPANLLDCIDGIQLDEWDMKIFFWNECRYDGTEPDVVIELDDTVILIEVKLDSGAGETQLEREAKLLREKYQHCRNKFLILLARESSAVGIYAEHEELIGEGVGFGYITWEDVFTVLIGICTADPFQEVIKQDLIALLKRKGFERFKCFDVDVPTINPSEYWGIGCMAIPSFVFEYVRGIKGDLYYEFK